MKVHARDCVMVGVLALCFSALSAWGAPATEKKTQLADLEAIAARFRTLGEFLQNLPAQREYEKKLGEYYGTTKFPCETFPEVLGQVKRWLNNAPELAERLWQPRSATAREFAWTESGVEQRYRFISTQRLFHGIWEDLSRGGCPAADCVAPGIARPGRWAAALEGSEVVHVERNGKFTGASVLVSTVKSNFKQYRLVSHNTDAKLIQRWTKSSSTSVPYAIANAKSVNRVSDGTELGRTTEFAFGDPLSAKLALLLPGRCDQGDVSLAVGGAVGAPSVVGGVGGIGAGGLPGAAANPAAQAALNNIVMNLSAGGAKNAPTSPKSIELFLGNALKNQKNPELRAQAALGLGALSKLQSSDPGRMRSSGFSPGSGFASNPPSPSSFDPGTIGLLNGGLDDPSPKVRAMSAITLANDGDKQMPPAIQKKMGDALYSAATDPKKVAPSFGGSAAGAGAAATATPAFGSPDSIRDLANKGFIREGLQLDDKQRDDLVQRIKDPKNPNQPKDAETYARDYLSHRSLAGARRAMEKLQREAQKDPTFALSVKTAIENQLKTAVCKECDDGKD